MFGPGANKPLQILRLAELPRRGALKSVMAAEERILVDQRDLHTGFCRRERGREAGRPGADDRDVGPKALLVVSIRRNMRRVDPAEPGNPPDHALVLRPHEAGLVERLVIEADRHHEIERAGVARTSNSGDGQAFW